MIRSQTFFSLAIVTLAFIVVWFVFVFPKTTQLPVDFSHTLQQSGEVRLFNQDSGGWDRNSSNIGLYSFVSGVGENNYVIENHFQEFSPDGLLIFDASSEYAVDSRTLENLKGVIDVDRDGAAYFPRFVEKRDYIMHSPFVVEEATVVSFVSEDEILGEELYKFSYHVDYIDKTHFFPSHTYGENEVIQGNHSGSIWVEPTTGYVIRYEHNGENNVFSSESLEYIRPYEVWSNSTTEDSMSLNIDLALSSKKQIKMYRNVVPFLAIFFLIAFLLLSVLKMGDKVISSVNVDSTRRIIFYSGAIVSLGGLVVMTGWILDIDVLKSVVPGFVTMKFTTALMFLLSGLILMNLDIKETADRNKITPQIVLPIASLIILLLSVIIVVSAIFGIQTGIENLFVSERKGAVLTTIPGRPSVGTLINFILMGGIGIIGLSNLKIKKKVIFGAGSAISLIAAISLAGYIFGIPELYWHIGDLSTAMALHTSILFLLLGVSLSLSNTSNKNKKQAVLNNSKKI